MLDKKNHQGLMGFNQLYIFQPPRNSLRKRYSKLEMSFCYFIRNLVAAIFNTVVEVYALRRQRCL